LSLPEQQFLEALETVQERLQYRFANPGLLARALTHRSFANENENPVEDNERYEFLGDAVLELVVSERLFEQFPDMPEGQLSRARAHLVRAETLSRVAIDADLGGTLRLGRGEIATGGRTKKSVLADAVEAVLGAIYLDGGLEQARSTVQLLLGDYFQLSPSELVRPDPKNRLQEWLQERGYPVPEYRLVDELGPQHDRRFVVEVVVQEQSISLARGRSKKVAAGRAARLALTLLQAEGVEALSPTKSDEA
jgi:ribonuclease III